MIGPIDLAGGAEALAGRTADDEIDISSADEFFQLAWREGSEVLIEGVFDLWEIGFKNPNRRRLKIDGSKPLETRPLEAEAEAAASAEKIDEGML